MREGTKLSLQQQAQQVTATRDVGDTAMTPQIEGPLGSKTTKTGKRQALEYYKEKEPLIGPPTEEEVQDELMQL